MSLNILRIFVLLGALLATVAGTISPASADPGQALTTKVITWKLSRGKVLSKGTTKDVPEGKIVSGCVIEGQAVSANQGIPFSKGKYRVSLTLFSPKRDLPGQKAGTWYLTGDWTITNTAASREDLAARHNSHETGGSFSLDSPFNPLVGKGNLNGSLLLRSNGAQGKVGSVGRGNFAVNQLFEGRLLVPAPR